jgi:branched-chain amino acid transport system substrate-binding protein
MRHTAGGRMTHAHTDYLGRHRKGEKMRSINVWVAALSLAIASHMLVARADAQELKMGVVSFLSGPAAGPFGVPARNGAELMIDAINKGEVPAPYNTKGAAGMPIKAEFVDESGGNVKQVKEFRDLAQSRGAKVVVGYISSGSCIAIAPVADELKVLTVFPTCGASSLYEGASRKYSFRTVTNVAGENIAAALYVRDVFPNVKTYTGINPNYAYGRESWTMFVAAMKVINPKIKLEGHEAWPKLFSGQYASEISSLLLRKVDLVHSSLWGGDVESFLLQGKTRSLFASKKMMLTIGGTASYSLGKQMPDGLAVGGHGPYGLVAEDRDTPLNKWFVKAYKTRYGSVPVSSAYQYAQSVLAVKIAYDKAAGKESAPTVDDAVKAFEGMTFKSITTTVHMSLSGGHQAVHENGYGLTKWDKAAGRPTATQVKFYPANCVMPPKGVKSLDWIKGGMKGSTCLK